MTTADIRNRIQHIDQWLAMPADGFGECDQCHNATVALWDDMDDDPQQGWQYCRECWQKRRTALADKYRKLTCPQAIH